MQKGLHAKDLEKFASPPNYVECVNISSKLSVRCLFFYVMFNQKAFGEHLLLPPLFPSSFLSLYLEAAMNKHSLDTINGRLQRRRR